MRYWSDDCEVYAAESLDGVRDELIALNSIDPEDWDPEEWVEVSGNFLMWNCEPQSLDKHEHNKIYHFWIRLLHLRPIWWVHFLRQDWTETGRAWFLCSNEW